MNMVTQPTITVYGITACDSMKKAFAALTSAGKDFSFHDYKKAGISAEHLQHWLAEAGLETVLNKRGTTWRKLDSEQQLAAATPDLAIELMRQNTSLIKRPIVEITAADGTIRIFVGLDALQTQLIG